MILSEAASTLAGLETTGTKQSVVTVQRPKENEPTDDSTVVLPGEDWRWTAVLAQKGFLLIEIAAIRRKAVDEILDDLTLAAKAGIAFSTAKLVDANTQRAMQLVRLDPPAARAEPIFRERPALLRLAQALKG